MHRRVKVPSRINIIGEHTDYAGGLALPFAIAPFLELEIIPCDNDFIGDETVVQLWRAVGGYPAKLVVNSSIPIGKGMSSSAALCIAIVIGVKPDLNRLQICLKAQRLEHEVLGTKCGLLDQMAMVFARKNYACLINFDELSVEHIAIPKSWRFKLVDSKIHRKLADIGYQANAEYLLEHLTKENQRVTEALNSDAKELGLLLNQSHQSLVNLGVSLPEIDRLVNNLQSTPGVLGARMMGGGYGGMILVIVESDEILPDSRTVSSTGSFSFEEFS
ncbi:MAG TPA: hypothetical protein HA354_07565 [Candidatus Poseidoniaceae archaeon]|nr:hypothetical protein [Euryarchaeota archaeon]DAC56146.1 MAG TPA: hypothetical protein D7I07_07565 [Candidatus Poseidoniales archaeon]HII38343.1 hypothetical protein [Candidatus Poseidoniaceae archaeon]|tara:strand:+ start:200 stop:1024 length:825 start_codon:yes stop_codon:yes gene_type:complete